MQNKNSHGRRLLITVVFLTTTIFNVWAQICSPGFAGSPCSACESGKFSIGGSGATCLICPLNSNSSTAASSCFVNPGYYDLGASLAAYYPFNSGDSFLFDISGKLGQLAASSNAPTGSTSSVDGLSHSASFDGTKSQYLIVPELQFGNAFTICAWYLIDSAVTRNWNRLFDFGIERTQNAASNNVNAALCYQTDLCVEHFAAGTNIIFHRISNHASQTNRWYHVCLGWDQGDTGAGTLYVEAETNLQHTSPTATPNRRDPSKNLTSNYLGKSNVPTDTASYWHGKIDDFRIYKRLITYNEYYKLRDWRSSGDIRTTVMPIACTGSCSAGRVLRCSGQFSEVCCSAGQFYREGVDSSCQPCPVGTYSVDGAGTSCAACAAGSFSTGAEYFPFFPSCARATCKRGSWMYLRGRPIFQGS